MIWKTQKASWNPFAQFPKRASTDVVSPSKIKMGLADRIKARKGVGVASDLAARAGLASMNTPWTFAGQGVVKAQKQTARGIASALTGGASEVKSGIGKIAGKLKFW